MEAPEVPEESKNRALIRIQTIFAELLAACRDINVLPLTTEVKHF